MSTGKKMVNGFDIPEREMTKEEVSRTVTWERFREFHYAAGEDFLDQTSEGNGLIFGGWLLHKYPQHCEDILLVCNNKPDVQSFNELEFLGYSEDKDIDELYVELAEFVNLTGALKRRINTILILVTEHYSG